MKVTSIACDGCGAHEDTKPIKTWSARRGSTHYRGELCDDCFEAMLDTYRPESKHGNRHAIVETKLKDIQKKA
jgi:hypothetical protein